MVKEEGAILRKHRLVLGYWENAEMAIIKSLVALLPVAFLLAGCFEDGLPKISEGDIIKSIEKSFIPHYTSSYNDEGGGVASVQIEVKDIRIGGIKQMQLEWGKLAENCWPVKANVRVIINHKQHAPQERKRGEWNPTVPNEGFCFYKDTFKEWVFQTVYM
ncbi:MAG: hypothetical protein HQL44_13335 [Alphaproteobacteria bacterium]|nr:hypothetical protein [Alphaproteobacteria bacterium]